MSIRVSKTTVSTLNPSFHLPEDVIIEILSRLPVKSLVRFTVVCKAWHALIENPNFISMHSKQNSNRNFYYLLVTNTPCYNTDKYVFAMSLHSGDGLDMPINLDFSFLGERDDLSIVGVCNGLVCIGFFLFEFDLVICNPSIRRFRKIPNFDALESDCIDNGEAAYGFAFDYRSDDYKLINLTRYTNGGRRDKAGVYTLSTDSWREIDIAEPIDDDLRVSGYSSPVVIDSVFYWECYKYPPYKGALLSFDMITESFAVISAPEGINGLWKDDFWKLIQLKEELAIFAFVGNRGFVVWTLNADSVNWSFKYAIGMLPVVATPVEVQDFCNISLVGHGKNGDVIYEDNTSDDVKLFSYDLESGEIKTFPFGKLWHDHQVFGYTESLITFKKNNQA